ncbi:HlyD family secretion protein [Parendozoicomonas sp. Alg238-R29]|uniref:efflux RND transporter periplasmic adaptor subunit n=1 Tax=Parendozoicomonas sp. Alg238-R29 TaxID=2993446 RepID=UPI00248E2CA1|nr:HlyD family secretion protein [Parendozoicomonas sp. Alg238-R29]
MSAFYSSVLLRLRSHPLRWPLAAIVATIFIITVLNLTSEQTRKDQAPVSRWKVDVESVEFNKEFIETRLYGRIETPRLVTLTSPVTAYVREAFVLEGQHVEKDSQLVSIDLRDQQWIVQQREADVVDAKARVASEQLRALADRQSLEQELALQNIAEREYQRQVALMEQGLLSESLLETAQGNLARQKLVVIERQQNAEDHANRLSQAKAQLLRAEATYQQAQLELQRSKITAPFSGRVTSVGAAQGERVRAGDTLIELYPSDSLEVRAQIPDRYLDNVKKLLINKTTVNGYIVDAEHQVAVELTRLDADVDDGRGGVDAFFKTHPDSELNIALGRPVALVLRIPASDNVVSIEPRSLYDDSYIYRVTPDNVLEAIEVKRMGSFSEADQEKVLVASEKLQAGDHILLTRIANAVSGLAVDIAEPASE